MDVRELKPCPFCGGKPYLETRHRAFIQAQTTRVAFVRCTECNARTQRFELQSFGCTSSSKEANKKAIEVDECNHKDCPYRAEPITNADRIRAMNDEELAKHLADIGLDCHLCAEHRRLDNEPLLRGEKCDEKCADHCFEWLKHPAD